MGRPLYIFDLDGTLALNGHRQGILEDGLPKRWDRFFAACVDDEPNTAVIQTLQQLSMYCDIWIWSGRWDAVRGETEFWLRENNVAIFLAGGVSGLRMRPVGDKRPDHELKAEWLASMTVADRERLVAVFDDRDSVVAMWRAAGVPCFQVAPGAF
jgi:hypothetical protein